MTDQNTTAAQDESEQQIERLPRAMAEKMRHLRGNIQAKAQVAAATWDDLSARLRAHIGERDFARWFADAKARVTINAERASVLLQLTFPTGFICNWVQAHYADLIRALWQEMEPSGRVDIAVMAAPPAETLPVKTGEVLQFPAWPDDRRAALNAVFRSALFPALNNKQPRRYLEEERIASVEGITLFFTGKQFDQSDLDVYLELLHIARLNLFGIEACFSAYSLLRALGHATGKANHKWLHSVLIRLRSGTVDMTDHGVRYFGGLIEGGFKDEVSKHYAVSINPAFASFFKAGMWATLDIEQRRALGRNQGAKALHAYYSTHAAPGPHTYERLAEVIGLTDKTLRNVKARIIKYHESLRQVGFLSAYEVGVSTIKASVNHTPGQARHIVREIVKGRRSRKEKGTV